MPSHDDHRSRRTIIALSHGKPRPYRRHMFSDEPHRLSRVQIGLLAFGATMVAALILSIAVIVQEHSNAERGKEIVAAQPPSLPVYAPPTRSVGSTAILRDDSSLPATEPEVAHAPLPRLRPPPLVRPPARPSVTPASTGALPHTARNRAPVLPKRAPPAPVDPDVALIASILELTPPSATQTDLSGAVCTPAEVLDHGCGHPQGMRP